jgi:hypothetical protein
MFGLKIVEFDNGDGTVESFNKIFPNTPLKGSGEVEILGIPLFNKGNLYTRDISFNGEIFEFDFGQQNFMNLNYFTEDKIRFKYIARNLKGEILGTANNIKSLSEKLGCSESIIKNRLTKSIFQESETKYTFNITRIEL